MRATPYSVHRLSTPGWFVPIAWVALFILAGPLIALLVSIPWGEVPELVRTPEAVAAFRLSLMTSLASTVICIVLGTPLAVWLGSLTRPESWTHRGTISRGAISLIQLVVFAPLVLSPVVSGLAMVFLWGRRGFVGEWLDDRGISIAYTTLGVVVVQVFVALPFFVATTMTALKAIPIQLSEAAATEGATPTRTFFHILLPLAAPGIATGAVVSFARALSEFGATITFAGNVEGQTQTIPLLVSLGLSSGDMDQALGACILLLGIYVLVVACVAFIQCVRKLRRL